MNSFAAIHTWRSYVNKRKKFQQGNAMAANKSTLRKWLNEAIIKIPIWLFPFFIFL